MELEQDRAQQETRSSEPQRGSLLSMLFDNRISMRRYVLRAAVISFLPSMMIVAILASSGIMTEERTPNFAGNPLYLLLMVVVIGPPIETLLMVPILWILSFLTRREVPLAAMSACIWAGFHSLFASAWGLGVIWPFFVFSCSYLNWRKRSFWWAIVITSCIHSFQNLIPGIVAAFAQ